MRSTNKATVSVRFSAFGEPRIQLDDNLQSFALSKHELDSAHNNFPKAIFPTLTTETSVSGFFGCRGERSATIQHAIASPVY